MAVSTYGYARGKYQKFTTSSTANVATLTGTQGSHAGGGVSIIVSGTGAGLVEILFVDAEEVTVTGDPIASGTKVANELFIVNYGGRLPKFIVMVTPSSSSSQEWLVEILGVN